MIERVVFYRRPPTEEEKAAARSWGVNIGDVVGCGLATDGAKPIGGVYRVTAMTATTMTIEEVEKPAAAPAPGSEYVLEYSHAEGAMVARPRVKPEGS